MSRRGGMCELTVTRALCYHHLLITRLTLPTQIGASRENKQRTHGSDDSSPNTNSLVNRKESSLPSGFHIITFPCSELPAVLLWEPEWINVVVMLFTVSCYRVLHCVATKWTEEAGFILNPLEWFTAVITRADKLWSVAREEKQENVVYFPKPSVMFWVSSSYLVRRSKYMSDVVYKTSN